MSQEVVMFDPTRQDSKYAPIMGAAGGCMPCVRFVHKHLPGWTFDAYVAQREKDEQVSVELNDAIVQANKPDGCTTVTTLNTGMLLESGFEIYEKKAVLNHSQVVKEFKKMPSTLRMQAYGISTSHGKKVMYMCERTQAFKLRYPVIKLRVGSSDQIAAMSSGGDKPKLFPSHNSMLLMGLAAQRELEDKQDNSATPSKTLLTWGEHVPSNDELLHRATLVDRRYERRRKRGRSSSDLGARVDDCLDEGESDFDGEVASADEAEDSIVDLEASPCPEKAGCETPIPPSKASSVCVPKSAELCRDVPLWKKAKPESVEALAELNPHQVGSAEYWIHELPLWKALDDEAIGRQLRQARDLLKKLPDPQKAALRNRVDLIETAKQVNYKAVGTVSDTDLSRQWTLLSKAGAKPTKKLSVALCSRKSVSDGASFQKLASRQEKILLLQGVFKRNTVWSPGGSDSTPECNVLAPSLDSVGLPEKAVQKLFVEAVFVEILSKLVALGEPGIPVIDVFTEVASQMLQLPEDAEITDECANLLLEAQATVQAWQVLTADCVSASSCLEGYSAVARLDEALEVVYYNDCSPLSAMAMAVKQQPFWLQRLQSMCKHLAFLKEQGPLIKADHAIVLALAKSPRADSITQLDDIVSKVTYWEAAVPSLDVAGKLKTDLIQAGESLVAELLSKDEGKLGATMDQHASAIAIRQVRGLFTSLFKMCPGEGNMTNILKLLDKAMVNMDVETKQAMCSDAIAAWNASDSELGHKLKDALAACEGQDLSEGLIKSLNDLWYFICRETTYKPSDTFLLAEKSNTFMTLDLISSAIDDSTPGLDCRFSKFSEYIHAAWRVRVLTSELVALCDQDEPPPSDAAREKICRELLRAKQRVDSLKLSVLKLAFVEEFDVLPKVDHVLNVAQTHVQTVAGQIRDRLAQAVSTEIEKMEAMFKEVPNLSGYMQKLEASDDLNDIRAFWRDTFSAQEVESWLPVAGNCEELLKQMVNKTNDFDLGSKVDVQKSGEKAVKQVRALYCVHSILSILDDPTLKGNKVAIRKRMRNVQSDLKTFQLRPLDLYNEAVNQAFKDGLAMKG